ncbi:MAG: fibronectin type III domain-containing protein, partial [Gammaproteobacteria bacterium]|nr:fibronectin type III domain-containing protein [Gammaproteobacteria bacterium]
GLAEKDENSLLSDPLFADIDAANHEYDFHLKAASPCIDAGDDSSVLKDALDNSVLDIGAYGGPNASVYPPPVSFKVEESTVDGTNYSMSFRWQPLTAYEVDHADGGYNIYFGSSSNSYEYTSGTQTSPLTDLLVTTSADGENQLTVDGFQSPANDLSSPGSGEITAYNQRLEINWDAVDGATGYQLIYVGGDGDTDTIDVEDVTSYTLSGLSNGVSYSVLIQAYAQPTLYFYIKAFEGLSTNKNESLWYEEFQESVTLGEKVLSDSSLTLSATPDEIRPYPVLPNEGCFIATATYGNYDAEQVQVFRDFRDQFLLTNAIGAQFVQLYYQYGPIAANYLTEHPAYKPAMQALLYPYLLLASAFVEVGVFAGAFFVLMCLGIAGLLVFALFVSSFRWEKRHVI